MWQSERRKLESTYQNDLEVDETKFPIMKLPLELRQMIYGYAMNFHQRVQIPYHPLELPGQEQLQKNEGFNVLLLNKEIHTEPINLFRKKCTAYIPMDVNTNVDIMWKHLQQGKAWLLESAVTTALMALTHSQDVHIAFYVSGSFRSNVLWAADLEKVVIRLEEIAVMISYPSLATKDRGSLPIFSKVLNWLQSITHIQAGRLQLGLFSTT